MVSSMSYKKFTVNRRGRMRMGLTDTRTFSVDGEYIHIVDANGKKSTIHFSSVLGCKVSRKHPTHFKVRLAAARFLNSGTESQPNHLD